MAAHPQVPPSELVLEPPVDPLHRRARRCATCSRSPSLGSPVRCASRPCRTASADPPAALPASSTPAVASASAAARAAPRLRGRPCLRFCLTGLDLRTGCSRAGIAVESRETCPAKRSCSVRSTKASCKRPANSLVAKPAKAREKVASLGTARTVSQPHSQRSVGSLRSRSTSGPGGGHSEHRLGQKSSRQVGPALLRATSPAAPRAGQQLSHADELQHWDQALVPLAERAEFLDQPREQRLLEGEPALRHGVFEGQVRSPLPRWIFAEFQSSNRG